VGVSMHERTERGRQEERSYFELQIDAVPNYSGHSCRTRGHIRADYDRSLAVRVSLSTQPAARCKGDDSHISAESMTGRLRTDSTSLWMI
jgi:hypothetical protein